MIGGRPRAYKHIGDDASAGQWLAQVRKGPLRFRPAEEDIIRLTYAASRSLADK
jgi:hypothetical protein